MWKESREHPGTKGNGGLPAFPCLRVSVGSFPKAIYYFHLKKKEKEKVSQHMRVNKTHPVYSRQEGRGKDVEKKVEPVMENPGAASSWKRAWSAARDICPGKPPAPLGMRPPR